jgi:hypothetical protein
VAGGQRFLQRQLTHYVEGFARCGRLLTGKAMHGQRTSAGKQRFGVLRGYPLGFEHAIEI